MQINRFPKKCHWSKPGRLCLQTTLLITINWSLPRKLEVVYGYGPIFVIRLKIVMVLSALNFWLYLKKNKKILWCMANHRNLSLNYLIYQKQKYIWYLMNVNQCAICILWNRGNIWITVIKLVSDITKVPFELPPTPLVQIKKNVKKCKTNE